MRRVKKHTATSLNRYTYVYVVDSRHVIVELLKITVNMTALKKRSKYMVRETLVPDTKTEAMLVQGMSKMEASCRS